MQDVTINVFRRLHRIELRFPGALLAYLRRSVSNRVADEHRRAVRQGPTATLDENLPDGQQSPLDATIDRDKVRVYRAALLTLNADDRLAIVLRLERGEGYDLIAARLGKPTPNAARVAVARAMFKLAKQMGPLPARGSRAGRRGRHAGNADAGRRALTHRRGWRPYDGTRAASSSRLSRTSASVRPRATASSKSCSAPGRSPCASRSTARR